LKTCDILPKPKVKASKFPVHISNFLQNCKKGSYRSDDIWNLNDCNKLREYGVTSSVFCRL